MTGRLLITAVTSQLTFGSVGTSSEEEQRDAIKLERKP